MVNRVKENKSLIFKLIIAPEYKIWRHLFLMVALAVISLNYAYMTFLDDLSVIGNKIYLFTAFVIFSYLLLVYVCLHYLANKYLLDKKYFQYLTGTVFAVGIIMVIQLFGEYLFLKISRLSPRVPSYYINGNLSYIDLITSFLINNLCVFGFSISMLLKQWMFENERIAKLEEEQLKTKLEQLKDQVTPLFLFNVLNKTGHLSKTDPETASNMLMQLSHILRYQLYDCSRDKVLLGSEINFLYSFFKLVQLYNKELDFNIRTEGDIKEIFVPPLLFITFIQNVVNNTINHGGDKVELELLFALNNKCLHFVLKHDCRIVDNNYLVNVKKRLSLLFPSGYKLKHSTQEPSHNVIELKLSLLIILM